MPRSRLPLPKRYTLVQTHLNGTPSPPRHRGCPSTYSDACLDLSVAELVVCIVAFSNSPLAPLTLLHLEV